MGQDILRGHTKGFRKKRQKRLKKAKAPNLFDPTPSVIEQLCVNIVGRKQLKPGDRLHMFRDENGEVRLAYENTLCARGTSLPPTMRMFLDNNSGHAEVVVEEVIPYANKAYVRVEQ